MSAEKIQALYQKLVYWVADTAPDDWRKVTINIEMLADSGTASSSWIIHCYIGDEQKDVDYPAKGAQKIVMRDLFLELNDLSAESGDRWTICDFSVTNDGRYKADLAYDAPPRLNGDKLAGTGAKL